MKTITTTASIRRADSSLDATLNPVALSSGEIVSWGVAFPRLDYEARRAAVVTGTQRAIRYECSPSHISAEPTFA